MSNMTVGRSWLIHILVLYLDSTLREGNGDDHLVLSMPFTVLSIKHWDYVSSNSSHVSFQTWLTGFKKHLSDINSGLMNIRR